MKKSEEIRLFGDIIAAIEKEKMPVFDTATEWATEWRYRFDLERYKNDSEYASEINNEFYEFTASANYRNTLIDSIVERFTISY